MGTIKTRLSGAAALVCLLVGSRHADACTAGTLDCLSLSPDGGIIATPKVGISCVGWDCTGSADTAGLVTSDAGVAGDGALPRLLNALGGSKYLNRLTQYYGYPLTTWITNPTALYGGYYHDTVLVSSQGCGFGFQCASGICVNNVCVSACNKDSDCDYGNGNGHCDLPTGTCNCTIEANCGDSTWTNTCLKNTRPGGGGYCQTFNGWDEFQAAWRARGPLGFSSSDTDSIVALLLPDAPGPNRFTFNSHGTAWRSGVAQTATPYIFLVHPEWGGRVNEVGSFEHEMAEQITNPRKWADTPQDGGTAWSGSSGIGNQEIADIVSNSQAGWACDASADCQPTLKNCRQYASGYPGADAGPGYYCSNACATDDDCRTTRNQFRCDTQLTGDYPDAGVPYACVSVYGAGQHFGHWTAIDTTTDRYSQDGLVSNASNNGAGAPVFARSGYGAMFFLTSSVNVRQLGAPLNGTWTGHDWGAPSGATLTGTVTAASLQPNNIQVFVFDTSWVLHHAYSTDGGATVHWDSNAPATGCASAPYGPEVVSPQPGVMHLFVECQRRLVGNTLYEYTYSTATGAWASAIDITPSFAMASAPAAASPDPDRVDIYMLGTVNGVKHLWLGNAQGSVSASGVGTGVPYNTISWYDLDNGSLPGPVPAYAGDPDAGSWMHGHLDAAILDTSGNTYLVEYDETGLNTATGWARYNLGKPNTAVSYYPRPGVTGLGDFRLLVSVADTTFNDVWVWKFLDNESSGSWTYQDTAAGAHGGLDMFTW